jgi:antitoxin component YwqK of YwqJK toxin-antitoxin module
VPLGMGTVKEYYENGKLKTQGAFKDGKLEGMFSVYDESGNLKPQ